MLVFTDESYDDDGSGGLRHVYAGFGVDEGVYRGLVAAVYQCKLKYFKQAGDMSPDEIHAARATHLVTAEPPADAELRAKKLLTAKQARHHAVHGNAPGILMAHELLDALQTAGATVFGVLSKPSTLDEVHERGEHLPIHLSRLLERIDLWMREQHPSAAAIIVPDTVHEGVDRQISRQIANFLYRSAEGQRMRRLVPNPFWVDSQTTAGSQLADIIAHILLNSMRPPPERKPLDDLWSKVVAMEFRSVDLHTRGIRRVRTKKQQTGAEAR